MKHFISSLLLGLVFVVFTTSPAWATVWSTDCSSSVLIQAQINSGSTVSGDTVKCNNPAGSSFSWASQVTIPGTKGITIDGTVGITLSGAGFLLTQNATATSRITGFTFTNQANCGSSSTPIQTQNNSTTPFADAPYRIDHNTFTNSANGVVFVCLNGDVRGLFDHNTLSAGPASEMIHIFGNGDWNTTDVVPGSANAVFIEDNTFTFLTGPAANYAMSEEAFNAAVFVFRHNTLNNTCNDIHNGGNGGRWWEIYSNTYNDTGNPYCFADVRGGSGVYFGNAAAAAAGGRVAQFGQTCPSSDTCSGNWPLANQIGRGISQNYSPGYAWGNSAFIPIVVNSSSNWVNIGSAPTDNSLCAGTANGHTAGVCDLVSTATKPVLLERCESVADVAAGCPVMYVYNPYVYPNPLQNQPTLVQHVSSSMEGDDSTPVNASKLIVTLPNPSLSGNLLIVGVQQNSGNSSGVSISDDKGNTWVAGPTRSGNQLVSLFYVANATVGTQQITATFSASTTCTPPGGGAAVPCITRAQMDVSEFYNVIGSPADGSTSGTIAAPGSITTTADGDLIYQYGVDDSNPGSITLGITGFTAGTGFTLLSADRTFGSTAQFEVQGAHGAISPTFSVTGNADTFGTVAMAFQSGAAGTAPAATGIRIVHVYHEFQPRPTPGNDPDIVGNFPSQGNLIVVLDASGRDVILNTSSDTNGNSYTVYCFGNSNTPQCAGSSSPSPNQGASIAYAVNATTSSTMVVTLKMQNTSGSATGHNMIVMYDVTGAATNPHDVDAGTQNTDSQCFGSPPRILTTVNITPTTSNGLIFSTVPVFQSTLIGISGNGSGDMVQNPLLDQGPTCGGANTAPSNLDEDNGYAHYYNPNTANTTFSFLHTISSVGHFTAVASAFKAANAVCTPSKLAFTSQPHNAALGASLGTVSVAVQDSGGNTCTGDTSTVTITLHPGTCTAMQLNGTTSGSASAGVFTTSNLNITNATGNCQLDASDGALTSATSVVFTIGDMTPPVCNPCTVLSTNNTSNSLTVIWTPATDPDDATASLLYLVCQSTISNISTIPGCLANAVNAFTTNISQLAVTVPVRNAIWFFNVIVEDPAGNQAIYNSQQFSLCASLEISPQLRSDAPPKPCNPIQ